MNLFKLCPFCNQNKPIAEFMTRNGRLKGYCKPCMSAYLKVKSYGDIPTRPVKCGICEREFDLHVKPHVDHNHNTGQFRDWLCAGCNKGLGMFEENVEWLRKAVLYLEKHNTVTA